MSTRTERRTDEGAILVMAIIIVTVVAMVVGVVLTRGDGSLRATVELRQVAGSSYAADGAAKLAINALRTGYSPGDPNGALPNDDWAFVNDFDGTGCFGKDSSGAAVTTLVLPNFYPATGGQSAPTSAAVSCVAEDATGVRGSPVPITNGNKPGSAILTLGTGGETGFYSKTLGGNDFRVHGGVWSNSNLVADTGALISSLSIRAHSGCTGTTTAPLVDCSAATVTDPAYASELDVAGASIPALQTVPSCTGNLATFEPGYYDDVAALNALTTPNANKSCIYHFKPGTYYFDFHANSSDPLFDSDISASGNDVWSVSSGTLVAGTRTGRTTLPGACVNPIDSTTADGVQFIFGGDSQLLVDKDGQAEICGTYHANRPPIAIYGQRTGTTSALTSATGGTALTADTVATSPATGAFTGATVNRLANVDGNTASWLRTSNGNPTSATITLDGFAPGSSVPKGAVVKSATLQVTHSEKTASAVKVTLTGPGTPASVTKTLTVRNNLTTDGVDLTDAVQKYVHDNGYTGAQVVFTGNPRKDETTALDAVRLELTYYVPALRGQTTSAISGNCVATIGGCAVLSTSGNKSILYVQGTSYTPLAKVDVTLNNVSTQVFRFGVIARALEVKETGSFLYPGSVIELPDNSPGWGFNGTLVQLAVYLCPASATCSTSAGELALKLRVQLWDASGTADPPNRQVTVLSWSEQR